MPNTLHCKEQKDYFNLANIEVCGPEMSFSSQAARHNECVTAWLSLLGNFCMDADVAVHNLGDLKIHTQAHDVDCLHQKQPVSSKKCNQHFITFLLALPARAQPATGMHIVAENHVACCTSKQTKYVGLMKLTSVHKVPCCLHSVCQAVTCL